LRAVDCGLLGRHKIGLMDSVYTGAYAIAKVPPEHIAVEQSTGTLGSWVANDSQGVA
jgi:hypothetical protein